MIPATSKYLTSIRRLLRATNDPSINDGTPACTKRALLVGVSYQGLDSNIISHLPGTEEDVLRIAKILVETQGYQLENIRVLVNGYHEHYVPTRANILKGLGWLVKNCRPGDFRTFTFAGHGFDDTQSIDHGDIYRKVYDKNRPLVKNDNGQHARCREQELTYSREAIAPQDVRWLKPLQDSDSSSGSETDYLSADEDNPGIVAISAKYARRRSATAQQPKSRSLATPKGLKIDLNRLIFDTELNNALSGLPEGSKLTCLFDCCHSGRMLCLPLKTGGGGYRSGRADARLATAVRNMHLVDSDNQKISSTTGEIKPIGEGGQLSRTGIQANLVNKLGLSHGLYIVKATDKGPLNKTVVDMEYSPHDLTSGQVEVAPEPQQHSYGNRADRGDRNDVESELLPKIEQQVNKIRARVLCWAGAHQRQNSQEIMDPELDKSYGLFTKAFCDAIQFGNLGAPDLRLPVTNKVVSLDQKPTYRQIFIAVDSGIERQLETFNSTLRKTDSNTSNLDQFPQLWSTHRLDDDLDKQFEM